MIRALVSGLVLAGGCLCGVVCQAADDLAQPGTRWVGSIKTANPEGAGKKQRVRMRSTDATLIIRSRDDKEFTADFTWGKESGVAVKGTIDKKGSVVFRATKDLRKTESDDLVDNARLQGTFKGEQFIGRYIVPGNDARSGEIKLELHKPVK
jgi:hypothetical protein